MELPPVLAAAQSLEKAKAAPACARLRNGHAIGHRAGPTAARSIVYTRAPRTTRSATGPLASDQVPS
jgi:hypothetical protein